MPLDALHNDASQKHPKKVRERDVSQKEPRPTDIDERLTALRRRTAGHPRSRDRLADRLVDHERDRFQSSQPPSTSASRPDRSPGLLPISSASKLSPASPKRTTSMQGIHSRTMDADHEDFSRRLKISNSSTPANAKQATSSKLFNPDTDPIHMRRNVEPESAFGTSTTFSMSRPVPNGSPISHRDERGGAQRQLFDHKKDDPVKFSMLTRPPHPSQGRPLPAHKSTGDYVSASSTSSYAPSVASSITLSSTTDSSASSALFDGHSQSHEQSSNNALSTQLKLLYREITGLENRIKQEDAQDEAEDLLEGRILIRAREMESSEIEKDKWKRRVADHKKLADIIHELLVISLAPSVPASLRQIPNKYNIIVRLWTFAFHRLLESLRRSSFTSTVALEHLQEFIYYAYKFYTSLLEDETLSGFRNGWLEALGDLARYRMAVAAMITSGAGNSNSANLTEKAILEAVYSGSSQAAQAAHGPPPPTTAAAAANPTTSTNVKKARIDDSPSPSVGAVAARLLEVEPEEESWRSIAREWYAAGLAEQPGTGKLHHHLGLLSREAEGEELRAVYHFIKSMTALHPFSTARESVLPLWSSPAQARRFLPDAHVSDLFVLLHGMLFTNIQLDDFQPVLLRFIERLGIDGAEEREWIMMAVINIGAIFEYGRSGGILRHAGGIASRDGDSTSGQMMMKVITKGIVPTSMQSDKMDVDGEPSLDGQAEQSAHHPVTVPANGNPSALPNTLDQANLPMPFILALQLTFSMLTHALHHPHIRSSVFTQADINPYLTVILTFLFTTLKHPAALQILERAVPWEDLAVLLTKVPKRYMNKQTHPTQPSPSSSNSSDRGKWAMLTNGCAPPLPEDRCVRGMEWVGRRVFERGYWKSDSVGEEYRSEIDILANGDHCETTDGKIEDDNDSDTGQGPPTHNDGQHRQPQQRTIMSQAERRWVRVLRCGIGIAEVVDGFSWTTGTKTWKVEGKLLEKVQMWNELEKATKLEEERIIGRRWVEETMDIDEHETIQSEESEDDESDSEEVKALKARRRYLRNLLQTTKEENTEHASSRRPRPAKTKPSRQPLCIVPGYTILVIDTNILLSSLPAFASLVESFQWTIVIPLPVIMELDGLATNPTPLGDAAQKAIAYISSHVRTHGLSLKVQTSKGNYLITLNVRTEQLDFTSGNGNTEWERSMDDLILKAAIWQDEHWVNRSSLLGQRSEENPQGAAKVVLLSLDRNLRVKARSRQLLAASENDLASVLASGK